MIKKNNWDWIWGKFLFSLIFSTNFGSRNTCPVRVKTKNSNFVGITNSLSEEEVSALEKPTFKDLWGVELNWTNSDEGWDLARRHQYLNIVRVMRDQKKNLKKFTKLGYNVIKIPQNVYDLILSERKGTVIGWL